jgi:hypothetical protein
LQSHFTLSFDKIKQIPAPVGGALAHPPDVLGPIADGVLLGM